VRAWRVDIAHLLCFDIVMLRDNDPVIEVVDLRMRYGEHTVLAGVDLTVAAGEVCCLLGPNGAGKTTAIEIMEGFRAPSSGCVRVFGVDPLHAGEALRARTGVVLQSWRDHPRWTPRELLDHLGALYRPFSTPTRPRPVDTVELIESVGLSAQADQRIATLSGGQRRRLDVAIGIVGRPDLLFLDEPTAGFDPEARQTFHDLIHRLTDAEGTTVMLTTHDLDEAERLADRVAILAGGRIVADGTLLELSASAASPAEIRWREGDERFVDVADDATAFLRVLLSSSDREITDVEVRRPSLADHYLRVVREHEHVSRSRRQVKEVRR
jgi:ABC-2 type transport system ATP-binding protein